MAGRRPGHGDKRNHRIFNALRDNVNTGRNVRSGCRSTVLRAFPAESPAMHRPVCLVGRLVSACRLLVRFRVRQDNESRWNPAGPGATARTQVPLVACRREIVMTRSDATQMILERKRQKGLSFEAIAKAVGRHKVWVTAALMGSGLLALAFALRRRGAEARRAI